MMRRRPPPPTKEGNNGERIDTNTFVSNTGTLRWWQWRWWSSCCEGGLSHLSSRLSCDFMPVPRSLGWFHACQWPENDIRMFFLVTSQRQRQRQDDFMPTSDSKMTNEYFQSQVSPQHNEDTDERAQSTGKSFFGRPIQVWPNPDFGPFPHLRLCTWVEAWSQMYPHSPWLAGRRWRSAL